MDQRTRQIGSSYILGLCDTLHIQFKKAAAGTSTNQSRTPANASTCIYGNHPAPMRAPPESCESSKESTTCTASMRRKDPGCPYGSVRMTRPDTHVRVRSDERARNPADPRESSRRIPRSVCLELPLSSMELGRPDPVESSGRCLASKGLRQTPATLQCLIQVRPTIHRSLRMDRRQLAESHCDSQRTH